MSLLPFSGPVIPTPVPVSKGGCFSKGTPVLMADGSRKAIEEVQIGDEVMSYENGDLTTHKVIGAFANGFGDKPMIQYRYEEEVITATYDHPFRYGEKYYPLYQLAGGAMEADMVSKLKLLCEQYGQIYNEELQQFRQTGSDDTYTIGDSERELLEALDLQQACERSPISSGSVPAESGEQTSSKPHQLQPLRQSSGELGVVYAIGECNTRLQVRPVQGHQRSGNENTIQTDIIDEGGPGNTEVLRRRSEANKEPSTESETAGEDVCEISTGINSYTQKHISPTGWVVKEREDYYAIAVEGSHTYIVGARAMFPVHNTGSATQNFVDLSSTAQTKLGSLTIGSSAAQQSITLVGITSGATLQILHDQFNARYNASTGAHAFSQTVIPSSNGNLALGGASNYWSGLYATTINLNSTASLSGGTAGQIGITGKLITDNSKTTAAGFNIGFGSAPTSPVNGDMWMLSSNGAFQYRDSSGTTKTLINTGQSFTLNDGVNIGFGTTTGTKIGTSTSQKLSLWNATPIVQPTTGIAAATFVANTSGTLNDTATWGGYTIGQVVQALQNIGALA